MPTQLSYLLHFKGLHEYEQSHVCEMLTDLYDASRGFGFSDLNIINEHNISCTLIYSSILNYKTFDTVTKKIVSDVRTVFSEVYFEIDFAKYFILVTGGNDKIKKLITVLSTLTQNKILIDFIFLDIRQTIESLYKLSDQLILRGLIIKNYRPHPDLSGKFAAKVQSREAADEILTTYGVDVSEFTASLELEDTEAKLRLSRSGAFAISSSEDGVRKCVELLKNIAKEGAYA